MLKRARRQRERQKTIGLISKKKNILARAEDFFAHCFVFHDYNMKLPTYTLYGKKIRMCSSSLFA